MYIGAACHDYEHPGVNNIFLVNTLNKLAIIYNDKSPLENHHVSGSFKITKEHSDCNIFENLSIQEYKKVRERLISMILKTDMSVHFEDIASLNSRLKS